MADDLADLVSRLDRIEELLSRRAPGPSAVSAGPEVRSARSIVSRIDDVWVAVTEGNERVVAAIEDARGVPAPADGEAGAGTMGPAAPDGAHAIARTEAAVQRVAGRLEQIEAMVSGLATPGGFGPEADDTAVHLRLNRIEEALAGVAGRLAEPHGADGAVLAALEGVDAEVRRLGRRVESMAQAVEASAARNGDGTLTERLARLRDQFRR